MMHNQSSKSSVHVHSLTFCCQVKTDFGIDLWVSESWLHRTFTLWRQKAASRPSEPSSRGPLSPLISLEELWKCVMQKWVDGEAASVCVCVREFYVGGCLCVVSASRWNSSMRVLDSAALGGPKYEHPLLVPVCFGSLPSTFCSAPSRPVYHRIGEARWDLEHNCANISTIQAIKHLLYGPVYYRHRI